MTVEEIEKVLIDIEQSKRYLNNLAKAIEFYRDKLSSPKSTSYSQSKVQSSKENIREEQLAELADLNRDYEKLLSQALRKEKQIYEAISYLDIEEQNILIEKYIHGQTWYQVAESFNYSESTILRRRRESLKKLSLYENIFQNLES